MTAIMRREAILNTIKWDTLDEKETKLYYYVYDLSTGKRFAAFSNLEDGVRFIAAKAARQFVLYDTNTKTLYVAAGGRVEPVEE